MKKAFIIFGIIACSFAFGQKNKSSKPRRIAPPPVREAAPPPVEKLSPIPEREEEKCFVNKQEEQKEDLIYVKETLLEYGWASTNARMVITTYNYDPIKKEEAEKNGDRLLYSQSLQFIEGDFKIEKGNLIFTPTKADKFKKKIFKFYYQPKTQKILHLEDENKQLLKTGKCLEPTISI